MFRSLPIKKSKFIVSRLLLLVTTLQLLLPVGIAYADAVFPGTRQYPTKNTDFCFQAFYQAGRNAGSFCYSTQALCQAALGPVPDSAVIGGKSQGGVSACKDYPNVTGEGAKTLPTKVFDYMTGTVSRFIAWAIEVLAMMFNEAMAKFLAAMAYLLDESIYRTVDANTYKNLAVVAVGWTAVRDIANLFFIFVLLYIAILTILQQAGSSAKRWVVNIVMAAVLINFSLFFTQVVIDSGNFLATGFWDKMKNTQGAVTTNSAAITLMQGFRVQTIYDTTQNISNVTGTKTLKLDSYHRAMINFGGGVVMFIAGYVFLAGAVMMIIRTVTLLVVMIASPFAFLGFALPKGGGFASKWLSQLMGATFVAPVFIIMLYLDTIIISGADKLALSGSQLEDWSFAIEGNTDNFGVVYNFILMIILVLGSLKVASAVSNGVGDSAGSWAKRGIGGGVLVGAGTTAFAGRQTVGRMGRSLKEAKWVDNLSKRTGLLGNIGRGFKTTGDVAQKSTFDIRNAPMKVGAGLTAGLGMAGIKAGTASKQTYEKGGAVGATVTGGYKGADAEKAAIEKLKERYKGNPEALEQALKSRFGLGAAYDAGRHKDLKAEVGRGVATEKEKQKIEEKTKLLKDSTQEQLDKKALDEQGKETGKTVGEAAAEAIKDSLSKLSGKEAEALIKKAATPDGQGNISKENQVVLGALGRQHLTHMNSNPADFSPDMLGHTNNAVMAEGGAGAQYLIQQAKMKTGVFPTKLDDELNKRRKTYVQEKAKLEALPETVEKRIALQKFEERHDDAMQDILGGMSFKEVARLDNATKEDPALVRNYTEKHFNEIENYHKNILKDTDKEPTQKMFARIRRNAATRGTKKTAEYMRNAKTDSLYYDAATATGSKVLTDAKKAHDQAKGALTNAQTKLDEAKAAGVVWKRNEAQQKFIAARDAEQQARETYESAQAAHDTNSASDGAADDDEEEDA